MVISRTPLRVSFIGGGTDIPEFYRNNPEGGAVISTTIDQYIYVAVNRLIEPRIKVKYSENEEVDSVEEIKNTRVKAILSEFELKEGIEIVSMATLPHSSGLGGSSAFTIGLLNALKKVIKGKEIIMPPQNLMLPLEEMAYRIEAERLGEPLGKQDQYACARGGFNLIEFKPDDSIKISSLKVPEDFKDYLLFFYTGNGHKASEVLADYDFEWLKPMNELINAFQGHLINARYESLGFILHESWMLKKKLSSRVSNYNLDVLYSKALNAGAWGGKLCGAGGGGFFMFIAPPEKHQTIREAVGLKEVKFSFTNEGSKIIYTG